MASDPCHAASADNADSSCECSENYAYTREHWGLYVRMTRDQSLVEYLHHHKIEGEELEYAIEDAKETYDDFHATVDQKGLARFRWRVAAELSEFYEGFKISERLKTAAQKATAEPTAGPITPLSYEELCTMYYDLFIYWEQIDTPMPDPEDAVINSHVENLVSTFNSKPQCTREDFTVFCNIMFNLLSQQLGHFAYVANATGVTS